MFSIAGPPHELNQIEHARQQGITDLYLTTHAGRPAWKLYQRIGFTEVDRFRSYALELNGSPKN